MLPQFSSLLSLFYPSIQLVTLTAFTGLAYKFHCQFFIYHDAISAHVYFYLYVVYFYVRTLLPPKQNLGHRNCCYNNGFQKIKQFDFFYTNVSKILILFPVLFSLLFYCSLYIRNEVSYVTFCTNLNLFKKRKYYPKSSMRSFSPVMLLLLLSECEFEQIILLIIFMTPNYGFVLDLILKLKKPLSLTLF